MNSLMSHYASIDDSLGCSSKLQLYGMGGAILDERKKVHVSPDSDNRYAHEREAQTMDRIVNNYLDSKVGREFVDYAHQQGKKFVPIVGIGTKDLGENTVAALITNDLEAILVSNYQGKGIEKRAREMAKMYGILDTQMMIDYVITHELAHAAGHRSEAETERFVGEFYTNLAQKSTGKEQEKYLVLAAVAEMRTEEAYQNEAN